MKADAAGRPQVEQNLERSKLFRTRPVVRLLDPDGESEYKDVLIMVEERPAAGK